MISHTTANFRRLLACLPPVVRSQAKDAYRLFRNNPNHPSLHFKRIHPEKPIYSVRINIGYRAVGILQTSEIIWFWIGPHRHYEKLLTKR